MKNRIAPTILWVVAPAVCLSSLTTLTARAATTPSATTPATAAATSANAVAVTVNNDKLMRADLDRAVAAIQASDPSLQTNTDAAKKALTTIRQSQIENWINSRLLLVEAAHRHIVASPTDVDTLVNSFKAQLGTPAAYQAFLKTGNKTEAQLRKFYGEQLVLNELSKRLAADVTISDAAIQKFYDAPSSEFEIPNQARAHQILLMVPQNASAADKAKIRAQALDILKKAQVPNADFNALIKQYSQDPGANGDGGDGGDTGEFAQDEALPPMKPFADAVFAAQSGQILGPVETVFGYHIVRVDEASHKPALDGDLKTTIRGFLVKQQVRQKLDTLIAQLKQTAKIQVNA